MQKLGMYLFVGSGLGADLYHKVATDMIELVLKCNFNAIVVGGEAMQMPDVPSIIVVSVEGVVPEIGIAVGRGDLVPQVGDLIQISTHNALYQNLDELPHPRPDALIVLPGGDNASDYKHTAIVALAVSHGIPVFVLNVHNFFDGWLLEMETVIRENLSHAIVLAAPSPKDLMRKLNEYLSPDTSAKRLMRLGCRSMHPHPKAKKQHFT